MIRRILHNLTHLSQKQIVYVLDFLIGVVVIVVLLIVLANQVHEMSALPQPTETAAVHTTAYVPATPCPAPTPLPTPKPTPTPTPEPTIFSNPDDLLLLAKTIHLESGTESYKCKLAVGSVILNRMNAYEQDLTSVIYARNQFSVIGDIPTCVPDEESLRAAEELNLTGSQYPKNMVFFRASHYHNWDVAWLQDHMHIDNTYFSLDLRIAAE